MKTKHFLKTNKQLLVTHADKGNITVVVNRDSYDGQLLELLNDISAYKEVHNPENMLKKNTFKIMDFWRTKGYLGDNLKRKDILCYVKIPIYREFMDFPKYINKTVHYVQ